MSASDLKIRRGTSMATEERIAVAEIRELIHQDESQLILFFCSSAYNLEKLAAELQAAFPNTPTIGCTSAGQVGTEGFTKGGITAISLEGSIAARPYVVDLPEMDQIVPQIAAEINALQRAQADCHLFGLLLVDGLSMMEEKLSSLLYRHLPQVPMVGGSAGDDLAFRQTHVYADGRFRTKAAVFTLFDTPLPFRTFKFKHFVPTEHVVVITDSDPDCRVVRELNGEPAIQVYAGLLGTSVEQLNEAIFAKHPFVWELGGDQYLRSISRINPDQSMTLFCAIEDGVVLSIAQTEDPVEAAQAAFQRIHDEIGEPILVIGCDCIQRRLEFESSGLLCTIGDILSRNHVFGFSTYGEQFDGLHMNQTFTGVAIGKVHAIK